MIQISGQSIKACVSYSNFKKCCEKKKKNTKKIRRTLKAHISGTAWRIQLKFGIGGAPPRGNSHRKFRVFLFKECWATDAWKRHFLYSCKIHTCQSCAPGFLGHTTHYRVSWPSWSLYSTIILYDTHTHSHTLSHVACMHDMYSCTRKHHSSHIKTCRYAHTYTATYWTHSLLVV